MAQPIHQMTSVLAEYQRHELCSFLNGHTAQPGQPVTMTCTTDSPVKGKWSIPDEDYEEFLDLMHDYLFQQGKSPMGFVERDRIIQQGKQEIGEKPVLIDLDFKYPNSLNLTRKFNEHHIRGFVRQITEGLKTFFDLNQYDTDGIRMFVSLRPIPYKTPGPNQVIKDGIHIESPDICLSNEKQKVLRAYLLEQNAVLECFESTGFINRQEDIYDKAMTHRQGWYFYGESKSNIPPYQIAYVFHYNPTTDEITNQDTSEYSSRELMELLSIRYKLLEDSNTVKDEAKDQYNRLLHWKGHATSTPVQQGQSGGEAVPEMSLVAQNNDLEVITRSMIHSLRGVSTDDIPLIKKLVIECLSDERAENYDTWMEVGWCLHHIASTPEMSDQMFDLWMDFSNRSSKSTNNNVSQLRRDWQRMSRPSSQRMLKWGSLNHWARSDNPVKYNEIMEEDLIEFIARHVINTHFHIASIMQKMFGTQYKASIDSKRTEWFTFSQEEHIWKHINQGVELRSKISNEVVDKVQKAKERIKRNNRNEDGEPTEYAQKRIKELLAVEKSLYTAGFKDCVMKECANLFYEEDFMSKLNLNPFLLVCKNGVLNLRATRTGSDGNQENFVEFRPGRPEDMMSFIAGREFGISDPIEYQPYNPNDIEQIELEEFLSKIFPRAELKEYAKVLMASCLEGMNREQCYYTLIGVGGNGKSKIVELMRMVLGEYQTGLAPTALTRKRPDSGAANPDIMAIKNRRFIYLQEPDDREPLNTSRMKQFSGEDVVEARGLFADQEKFKISGKLFMLCNNLPPIHAMDRGTWRRIRVIPFESKFVSEGDIGYEDLLAGRPNVFPKDCFLDEKLKRWRCAFLSLLVHIYETIYCVDGLKEPAIVREASNDYKEQFDSFAKFRNARVRRCPGERTDFNRITRAYRNYIDWQGGTGKRLTTTELRKRLEDDYGSPENGKFFKGIVVFDDEEELEKWERENTN